MARDLETTAVWLNARGYEVNNCFQLQGRWRVNVRRKDFRSNLVSESHFYADGETISDALDLLVTKRVNAEARLADTLETLRLAIWDLTA